MYEACCKKGLGFGVWGSGLGFGIGPRGASQRASLGIPPSYEVMALVATIRKSSVDSEASTAAPWTAQRGSTREFGKSLSRWSP